MSQLRKFLTTTVIPGDPGTPSVPGSPSIPARCVTTYVPVTTVIPDADQVAYYQQAVPGTYPDQITSLSSGYDFLSPIYSTPYSLSETITVYKEVTTCYPAVPAVAGTEGVPPTMSQIVTSKNLGWNSWARSVDPVMISQYYECNVPGASHGIFIGLGIAGLEGVSIGNFTHGLMVDTNQIQIYESGQVVSSLGSYDSDSTIQIVRLSTNEIMYVLINGTSMTSVKSSVPPKDSIVPLYVYGYLYSSDDVIPASEILDLETDIQEVEDCAAIFSGTGLAYVDQGAASVTLTGRASMYAKASYGSIDISLPALECLLAESSYSAIDIELPPLTCEMIGDQYIPPVVETIYGNLPALSCLIIGSSADGEAISATLPALQCHLSESGEGSIYVELPALWGLITYGYEHSVSLMSSAIARDGLLPTPIYIVVLNSQGVATDILSGDREVVIELISAAEASDQLSVLGIFSAEILDTLLGTDVITGFNSTKEPGALDFTAQVWVVNLNTGATTQYENYGFNDFFERDGEYYGVADDGIYHLDGDDDNGMTINSLIEFGKHDLDSAKVKNVANFYLGISSAGKVYLKVNADGNEYLYEARASSTDMKHQRVDIGKGLKGVYWKPTLISDVDFELETITFQPFNTSRNF